MSLRPPPSEILAAFGLEGIAPAPLGLGRINDTFRVGDWVVQRLNPTVFPAGDRVMANLQRILSHLGAKGLTPLRLRPTQTGALSLQDAQGAWWRCLSYLPGTRTVEGAATPEDAEAAARALGRYLHGLVDLPAPELQVILPDFHNTPARLAAFDRARAQATEDRKRDLAALDPILDQLRPLANGLVDADLPQRIAHDDTKLNNVLLDSVTGQGVCVLDLDTTQPGSWLADFGDMARSACNPVGEEEVPGESLRPDLTTFKALATGFLGELGPWLVPAEHCRLAIAPTVIAFELGLRFLTDHLEGDRVFRVTRPGDNLRRGASQVVLASGFLEARPQLQAILEVALKG